MEKLFVHWKFIFISLAVLLAAGLGSFFYFGNQQEELEQTTQSVQSAAFHAMEKKQQKSGSKIGGMDSGNEGNKSKTGVNDPKSQSVDYVGEDVKPLTVAAMKKVNADTVVSKFGVGTIQIPSIGMNLPILEGISQENLSVGAGTMKANQELGKGNFSLIGHYMTNAGLLFGSIKDVKKGSLVSIEYKNRIRNFKVTAVKHINAVENQVIYDSEGNDILTLITCDSSVVGTSGRYMVRCEAA